ncbi:MAG: DUF2256 domain-containing protein [bacterium]
MPKVERPAVPAPKTCISCARPFTWRKKWERDWDQVKYCSDACRRRGPSLGTEGATAHRTPPGERFAPRETRRTR